MDTIPELFQLVYDSIQAGGAGAAIGRNVFQAEDPTKVVQGLAKIVHENYTVEEVLREYWELNQDNVWKQDNIVSLSNQASY